LDSRNGFDFSEGFSVQVSGNEDETQLTVSFRDKKWQVSPRVIQEIINERDTLNELICTNNR